MTYAAVRCAILRDMFDNLKSWGFEVNLFTSIDDDELFLCISVEDDTAVDHYLMHSKAQLQIREGLNEKLGIRPPVDSYDCTSSPPYIPYDLRLVQKLNKAGVLADEDPHLLYKQWPVKGDPNKTSMVSDKHRIQIILRKILTNFNLDAAVDVGLIVDWYPAHTKHGLRPLKASWANFALLKDFSLVQPATLLRDYFGSRVAFTCAWTGVYAKCLLALMPIAILIIITVYVSRSIQASTGYTSRQVMSFGLVLVIWSRIAYNLWKREEAYFMKLWSIVDHEESGRGEERPQFIGYLAPSPLDLNVKEKQYPKHMKALRRLVTSSITVIFCGFVCLFVYVWMSIFEGNLNILASMCLACEIKVFELTWNFLVPKLVAFENHQHMAAHYDSYLWKQFAFQSVNYYSAFFYLAVILPRHASYCYDNDCLVMLRWQLSLTVFALAVCRIGEVLFYALSVRFSLWKEVYTLESQGKLVHTRSFAEEQAKYSKFRIRSQIENTLQLVLALGYVLIFGAVMPVLVPVCVAEFVVQLRANSFLLTMTAQRTVPRQQAGIGAWQDVVRLLMSIAVAFQALMLVKFGTCFEEATVLVKVTALLVYIFVMLLIFEIVDFLFPQKSDDAEILGHRRHYVEHKLQEACGNTYDLKKGTSKMGAPELGKMKSWDSESLSVSVHHGRWERIPHLDGTPVIRDGGGDADDDAEGTGDQSVTMDKVANLVKSQSLESASFKAAASMLGAHKTQSRIHSDSA
eukprot:gnl/TRDRNA2_/TRDRNA2_135040_c1_seq1.p1 gnl/TRDRNA2_/TRDRNA2_135040_c1~~gnl/TRDRNA2_/TRDRNA2_135040_c1_seq1.p1  ORF type:complete len:786 (+),score=117.30 gnl/TRDRNA2_/TRDRNA2_135040_c1_seq1:128-2359(+)